MTLLSSRLTSLIAFAVALALSGCSMTKAVRPVTVEVPVYTRQIIPEKLTDPLMVDVPIPLCLDEETKQPVYCNGQIGSILIELSGAINSCNIDRTTIRNSQVIDNKKK